MQVQSLYLKKILNLYNGVYRNAEDYGFWVELSKYTQFANINKVLLKYRILQGIIT